MSVHNSSIPGLVLVDVDDAVADSELDPRLPGVDGAVCDIPLSLSLSGLSG